MGTLVDLYNLAKFANRHPVARKNKSRTLQRFFSWQLASRTIGQPIVLPFIGDTRLMISKDVPGAAGNYYFGLPEFEEYSLMLHFLREGDLLGDIGANIGALTVAAAGLAKAHVIAMEPVPSTYMALCDNVAINHLGDRVRTLQMGAGEKISSLHFSTNRGSSDRIVTSGTGQELPVQPLDEIFAEPPNMLFLDVEGFEPAVIKGAARVLADSQLKIVIIETLGLAADYGLDDLEMHRSMLDHGFHTVHYDPIKRLLKRTEGMDPVNTIYVRDLAFVEQRVKSARSFVVDNMVI
jgi:FkbM family methyltransferase